MTKLYFFDKNEILILIFINNNNYIYKSQSLYIKKTNENKIIEMKKI